MYVLLDESVKMTVFPKLVMMWYSQITTLPVDLY